MPLQNRITPFGEIIVSRQRGTFTGNRGVIHNNNKEIVRNFKTKAWITCLLEYKNAKRTVMSPGRWTELFFLDEATAFAAGHRPCAFCRNRDFKRFKSLWLQENAEKYNLSDKKMATIDEILHLERIDNKGMKKTYKTILKDLPERVFVTFPENTAVNYLYLNQKLWKWTENGYETGIEVNPEQKVNVLTPASVVNVFKAGYVPEIHPDLLK